MASLRIWLQEARPQFLLASLVSVLVGTTLAIYEGFPFKPLDFALATAGALIAHIGIHAFNDYSDYMTGINLRVHRTPFSGGNGVLPSRWLAAMHVYYFGIACLVLVACIGIHFMATVGLAILRIGLLGVAIVYTYTSYLTRVGFGELGCVIGFALWSIGPYFADRSVQLEHTIVGHNNREFRVNQPIPCRDNSSMSAFYGGRLDLLQVQLRRIYLSLIGSQQDRPPVTSPL